MLWVMDQSGSILKHDNIIILNLKRYCYHRIKVASWNPGDGKVFDTL